MKKILVTGATGFMGSVVVQTLLKKIPSSHIHVLSRQEEKMAAMKALGIHTFTGSYEDVHSLERAMIGVDTVLLISGGDKGDRLQEHKNVIDTAKKAGVQNIAYTSRALRDRSSLHNTLMKDHFDTEDYIRQSGLQYIVFQNALYMEFLQFILNSDQLGQGIRLPVGDGRVSFTLRAEQAEAMAQVLLNDDFNNQTYTFTNTETYSFFDVAAALSTLSGKDINYFPVELQVFEEMMKQKQLPEPLIKKMSGFLCDISNSQEAVISSDLESKLGRKPALLKEGLKIVFGF